MDRPPLHTGDNALRWPGPIGRETACPGDETPRAHLVHTTPRAIARRRVVPCLIGIISHAACNGFPRMCIAIDCFAFVLVGDAPQRRIVRNTDGTATLRSRHRAVGVAVGLPAGCSSSVTDR